jgi:hypothetical protein
MAKQSFAWWEVTGNYFQIKFVSTLDVSTLVNANFVLYNDSASPTSITTPFDTIDVAKDYSSISRILTLWWNNPGPTGGYTLHVRNLRTFLGEALGDFQIPFEWVLESATPNSGSLDELLQPSRIPVEVEDYSLKTPGWSIIEPQAEVSPTAQALEVIDIAPGISSHHYIDTQENLGKIDILFSLPIYTNFISPFYFSLTKKSVKKGMSLWENVNTSVLGSFDSKLISIYLPAIDSLGNTVYSYGKSNEELEGLVFFEPQTKYRLVLSTQIGS